MSNNVAWAAAIDGTGNNFVNTQPSSGSSATDSSGNTYTVTVSDVAGGSIVVKNADGSTFGTTTQSSLLTGILVKRNSSGVVQWFVKMYNSNVSGAYIGLNSLSVDSNGNVYIGGIFYNANTLTFESTGGNPSKTVSKPSSDYGCFLGKYNSSGVAQWVIRPILYTQAAPSGVWATKSVGTDLFVLATSPGTSTAAPSYSIVNADGSTFRASITSSAPYQSTWLIKYNSSGIVQWATRCCEGAESRGIAIDVDSNGNIYIGGKCYATATYTVWQANGSSDQSSGTSLVTTAGADGFLIKYSSAGARLWSAAITGASGDVIWYSEYPVAIAASASAVYVSMKTSSTSLNIKLNNSGSGTTISSLGSGRGVCFKMLADGTFSWSVKVAPSDANYSNFESICLDSNENVYLSGVVTSASATFTSANNSTNTITRSGTYDGFITRFNSSGNYQSINQIINMNLPDWWKDGPDLAIDPSNNVTFSVSSQGSSGTNLIIKNPDGSTGSTYTRVNTGYSALNVKLNQVVTAPGAPTGVTATAGNGQAVVSFTAPASNGGSAITSYTVTSSPAPASGPATFSGSSSPITFTGLTNGTAYTFTVTATNAVGTSSASTASTAVTPGTAPAQPAAPSINSIGNGTVTIGWVAPESGGLSITGYTITVYNLTASTSSTISAAAGDTSKAISSLTNGSSYSFTIIATNELGSSIESVASATAVPYTVPGTPTGVNATPESLRALVTWTKPANNNGRAVTSYTITALQNGNPVLTPVVINGEDNTGGYVYGLSNGTAYTFTVKATNLAGDSSASSASSPVTPISDAPTTAVTTAVSTGNPDTITNYINETVVTTPEETADLTIEMRTSLNAGTIDATNEQKAETKLAYIDAMRAKVGADNYIIPSDKFTEFIRTLKTVTSEQLPPKPITAFVPVYTGTTATLDVSTVSNTNYLQFEVPIGYTIVLQNGIISISLTYNGTNYSDGNNTYTSGSVIVLGSKTFTLVGIGSGTVDVQNTSEIICITKGSMIQTPSGEVHVETLGKGDIVLTGDGRIVPITKMKQIVVVAANEINAPYVIEENAFGKGVPPNRLEVSPRHAIQLPNGLWDIPREAAKVNSKIYQNKDTIGKQVVYYHYALSNYATDTTIVNGQATECLNDGEFKESYGWNKAKQGYDRTLKPFQTIMKKH